MRLRLVSMSFLSGLRGSKALPARFPELWKAFGGGRSGRREQLCLSTTARAGSTPGCSESGSALARRTLGRGWSRPPAPPGRRLPACGPPRPRPEGWTAVDGAVPLRHALPSWTISPKTTRRPQASRTHRRHTILRLRRQSCGDNRATPSRMATRRPEAPRTHDSVVRRRLDGSQAGVGSGPRYQILSILCYMQLLQQFQDSKAVFCC